ncbi:MAG: HAD family hydrolase [Actinomycetota bacterium]
MKALMVDFGGVLTTSVLDSFAAFARAEGIEPEVLATVMQELTAQPDNLFQRIERGQIEMTEFEIEFSRELGKRCGVTPNPDGLKERLFVGAGPDEMMLAALRAVRESGVKTALISNSWGRAGYPIDEFSSMFDAIVISGEVGLRKPQPEIYLLASSKVGIDPADCVFIDDFAVNVEGARAVGMTAIHHRTHEQTIPQLEELFGITLR